MASVARFPSSTVLMSRRSHPQPVQPFIKREKTSPRINMDNSWSKDAAWSPSESASRRGRSNSSFPIPRSQQPSSMAAHLSYRSPLEIEEQILRDPELQDNQAAVLLYLRLDIWLLESIFALRGSASAELAQLHPTLFTSPPEALFNLIYTLRHLNFIGVDLAGTIGKVEALYPSTQGKDRSRELAGKIAPRGQAYGCPSKHCRKVFVKSGHAANHVEKQHPEYLNLHPDYQPSQFMVEHSRSRPTSPELERQEKVKSAHRPHELRPSTMTRRTPSVASEGLSVYFSDGAQASPKLQGYESQGDSDEAPRLVPSRNPSRNTNHPSPLHPETPRESYGQPSPDLSRYHLLAGQSKRGRACSSSLDSASSADVHEQGDATRCRHHAKRRSIIGFY